jgi:hypothetical protein
VGKVTLLIAEDAVDEAFYWSSISRSRKMKRIMSHLDRRLHELLKGKAKPTITLIDYLPKAEIPSPPQPYHARSTFEKELWKLETIHTIGLSQVLKWLIENQFKTTVPIEEVAEWSYEEESLEKVAAQTAIIAPEP